jgi:S1-C subfamily serine protease
VGANAGIGFAVPSAIVENVVPSLIESGVYEHPWIGISGTSMGLELAEAMGLESSQRGVLVSEILPDSPAEAAGLLGSDQTADIKGREVPVGGDIIVAIDGLQVDGFDDLVTYLARSTSVGDTVMLTILRDGQEESVQLTLAARPAVEEEIARSQQAPPPSPQPDAAGGGWLGIMGLTLTPEIAEEMGLASNQQGALIQEVIRGTPAEEAGLLGGDQVSEIDGQPVSLGGDIVVGVDGEAVAGMEELRSAILQTDPGQEVTLTILRAGDEIEITVTLGERPTSVP